MKQLKFTYINIQSLLFYNTKHLCTAVSSNIQWHWLHANPSPQRITQVFSIIVTGIYYRMYTLKETTIPWPLKAKKQEAQFKYI